MGTDPWVREYAERSVMSKAQHWRAQAEQCFKMAADGESWAKAALEELAADYIKLAEAEELTETPRDDTLTPEE
jgi:hypothetical protein